MDGNRNCSQLTLSWYRWWCWCRMSTQIRWVSNDLCFCIRLIINYSSTRAPHYYAVSLNKVLCGEECATLTTCASVWDPHNWSEIITRRQIRHIFPLWNYHQWRNQIFSIQTQTHTNSSHSGSLPIFLPIVLFTSLIAPLWNICPSVFLAISNSWVPMGLS